MSSSYIISLLLVLISVAASLFVAPSSAQNYPYRPAVSYPNRQPMTYRTQPSIYAPTRHQFIRPRVSPVVNSNSTNLTGSAAPASGVVTATAANMTTASNVTASPTTSMTSSSANLSQPLTTLSSAGTPRVVPTTIIPTRVNNMTSSAPATVAPAATRVA